MKKIGVFLCVALASVSLLAQVRTGTIWGHVTDTQGAPLQGVSVTLVSPFSAPVTALTDEQGIFRFPSLEPSTKYALTAELQGFKKEEKTGIIVVIGQQSRIDLTMEQGKLEEEVTVIAQTPTIDAKKVTVGKSVTQDIMQALPTTRDPWSIIQMVPGVITSKDNVGGSESGQQAAYYAKGDPTGGTNNVWAVDGVVVTDPAAIGASPIYWDFDSFEEMNVVTGGADVSIQTGGVALNMVTKRGGNKVTFGGRFYLTDSAFQANNLTPALEAQGVTAVNKVNQIKDYGFNLGGPIVKDKVWLWMSYGIQDINVTNIIGTVQNPLITDYNFKLNIQPIPSNRFEVLLTVASKTMTGQMSDLYFPEGYNLSQLQHWGTPIVKLQDEQMIGDKLLLSVKFDYMDPAIKLVPGSDPNGVNLVHWDATTGVQYDSGSYSTKRPTYHYDLFVQYYNDRLLGASHEIKLGVEYSPRRVTTDSSYPGQLYDMYNLYWGSLDPTASGNPQLIPGMNEFYLDHAIAIDGNVKQLSAFVQDTVTTGRFTFLLGLRFDRQTPSVNSSTWATVDNNPVWAQYFDPAVSQALAAFMPGTIVPSIKPDYHWNVWSPRLGITYDLLGTGKTILKLSGSVYGDFMGSGMTNYWYPQGTGGWMQFYWLDGALDGSNPKDGKVQAGELYTYDPVTFAPIPLIVSNGSGGYTVNPYFTANQYGINWYGFTPGSTASTPSPYTVDPNATSSRTWELLASVEHELLPDFSVTLNGTYRKYDHLSWDAPYYANGPYGDYSINGQNVVLGPGNYSPVGTVPSSITYTDNNGNTQTVNLGAGAGQTFYLLQAPFQGTPYIIHTLNTNYNTYWGIDLTFNKRLTNKWMLDGSLSYMDQRQHYGNGITNPTGLWAYQDAVTAPFLGRAIGQNVFSHWMVKLEGLYQLPLGFDISFTFNARAGHIIPHYMTITDYAYASTNPADTSVGTTWLDVFGTTKLPTFYQLNLRLEKMIKLGDTGRIFIMADAFNLTNADIINSRYDMYEGTYFIYPDGTTSFSPWAFYNKVYQILNPFIMRFGVRFQI